MSRTVISRRAALRGMLGGAVVSIALPPLDAMFNTHGTAYAGGAAVPKRFGVWFWGNGVRLARWTPRTTGAGWALTDELRPLAMVKDYINVVSGMEIKTGNPRGHHAGTVGILSGSPLIEQAHAADSFASTFSAPSIDVVAARAIGTTTRRANLAVGISRRVTTGEGTTLRYLSHNGPDSPNPSEYNPRTLFNTLFGAGFAPPGTRVPPDPRLALRRSVLDAVTADATALRGRLGAVDRVRLEQHLNGVRELERSISTMTPMTVTTACTRPMDPGLFPDMMGQEQIAQINRAMSDLLVMALACDITRVFSVLFSGSVGGTIFWQVGATRESHSMTHDEPGEQPIVHASVVFIMQQFAYLLERLRAVPEGAGNLLDNTVILASSDTAEGRVHSIRDYPILVAGRAGGALRFPGVHYRSTTAENTSKVLLTVLRAAGLTLASFGNGGGRVTEGCTAIQA